MAICTKENPLYLWPHGSRRSARLLQARAWSVAVASQREACLASTCPPRRFAASAQDTRDEEPPGLDSLAQHVTRGALRIESRGANAADAD
jgi:hypothetical protein